MKKRKIVAVVLAGSMLAGVLVGCSGGKAELLASPNQNENEQVTEQDRVISEPVSDETALWTFSYNMLKQNIGDSNPVLSPLSAYLAMGMVGLGAKGETLAEFEQVMGPGMQETAGSLMEALPFWIVDTSGNKEKSVLTVANSAWVDESMNPEEKWLTDVSEVYGAEVYRGALSSQAVMKDINNWVEAKTNSLIKKFLNEPLKDAKMALFNTIYFNGKWKSDFEAESTRKEDFTTTGGEVVKVEMMYDKRSEFYVKNDIVDGVVMDYRDGNMAFVALKPTAGQNVRELYEQLTYEELVELLDTGSNKQVKLKLPKFEVEFDKVLNDTLKNMGIQKAFEQDEADLSGLGYTVDGMLLYISLVRQKAVIKVDEEGTEAAAVTMVETVATSAMAPVDPIEVYFDEPFLYMIMDMESRIPLFMGVMDNPVE